MMSNTPRGLLDPRSERASGASERVQVDADGCNYGGSADGDPLDAARPAGAPGNAPGQPLRDGCQAHRRRAGDVPRRRRVATGIRGLAGARGPDGAPVHDRGRGLQPRAEPRPAGVQRRLLHPDARPTRRAAHPRSGGRPGCGAAARPGRDVADDPQARSDDGQHGPEPALPRPQQRPDGFAWRGLRAAHQRHRRASSAPGLGDGGGLQRQLPGPPASHPRRVRQRLQRRPGAQRPDPGERHQLTTAVRQAPVGRDADRPVRAVRRHQAAGP